MTELTADEPGRVLPAEPVRQHAGHPPRVPPARRPPGVRGPAGAGRDAVAELRHLLRLRAAARTSPVRPGSEEYLDSEKYQVRDWDLDGPLPAAGRPDQRDPPREPGPPAPRQPHVLRRRQRAGDRATASTTGRRNLIVVVNLDPHHAHEAAVGVPPSSACPPRSRSRPDRRRAYLWHGGPNYVGSTPTQPGPHPAGGDRAPRAAAPRTRRSGASWSASSRSITPIPTTCSARTRRAAVSSCARSGRAPRRWPSCPRAASASSWRHRSGRRVRRHPAAAQAALALPARGPRRGRNDELHVDPYAFSPTLGDLDLHLLGGGPARAPVREARRATCSSSTASPAPRSRSGRRTRARSASSATSTAGTAAVNPMRSLGGSGVWELFVPGVEPGSLLQVRAARARRAARAEGRPVRPSPPSGPLRPPRWSTTSRHDWGDADWLERRRARRPLDEPLSIYEVHLGSWRRNPLEGNRSLYLPRARRRARRLRRRPGLHPRRAAARDGAPVRAGRGATRSIGYYAPTSRLGTPDEFCAFVDRLHAAGSA